MGMVLRGCAIMDEVDNLVLVGLGGAGNAICIELQAFMDSKRPIYSIDCIKNVEFLYCFSQIYLDALPENIENFSNMADSAAYLLRFTPPESRFLFVVGLGGCTGTNLFKFFLSMAELKSSRFICILPFAFEGKNRAKIANDSLDFASTVNSCVYVYPNQYLLDGNHPNETFTEAFKRQAKMIFIDLQSELSR
jgi:hypothetical protein